MRTLSATLALTLALNCASALAPSAARACGGTFCSNSPINQNAERILFIKRPGDQATTAVVQIQAQGTDPDFAWVVPLDSLPTNIHEEPTNTFNFIDQQTSPTYQFSGGRSFAVGGGGGGGCGMADSAGTAGNFAAEEDRSVRVWASGETGNYAYDVVSSDDPRALRAWLDRNRYRTPEEAIPVIAEYVAEHKLFLAVRLRAVQNVPSFLVTPLAFTYTGRGPCVPIRLTRIASTPTLPVLAYVISDLRAVPMNFSQTQVSDAEVARLGPQRFSMVAGVGQLSAYDTLVTSAVRDAGGRAWITEFAGALPMGVRESLSPSLQALMPREPYLTRLYTTIGVREMDRDPEFVFVRGLPDVSNTHDLTRYTDRGHIVDLRFLLGASALAGALRFGRRLRRRGAAALDSAG